MIQSAMLVSYDKLYEYTVSYQINETCKIMVRTKRTRLTIISSMKTIIDRGSIRCTWNEVTVIIIREIAMTVRAPVAGNTVLRVLRIHWSQWC